MLNASKQMFARKIGVRFPFSELDEAADVPGGGQELVNWIVEHMHTCYLVHREHRCAWVMAAATARRVNGGRGGRGLVRREDARVVRRRRHGKDVRGSTKSDKTTQTTDTFNVLSQAYVFLTYVTWVNCPAA